MPPVSTLVDPNQVGNFVCVAPVLTVHQTQGVAVKKSSNLNPAESNIYRVDFRQVAR
jgi:hypothetical protein